MLREANQLIVDAVMANQPCNARDVANAIQADYDKTLRRMYRLGDRGILQLDKGLFTIRTDPLPVKPESEKPRRKSKYIPPLRIKPKLSMNVYLFRYGGYFKIGITKDVAMRQRKIQSYISEELVIVHYSAYEDAVTARQLELSLHERYAHRQVRGEWFKLEPCEVQEIISTLSAIPDSHERE